MFEDLEGINQVIERTEEVNNALSTRQAAYINECVEGENPSALIDRIDEMSSYQPPKGIDHNPAVSDIIDPMRDQIETKYLEAPGDIEQISQISDCLSEVDEIRYENWVELSLEDRQIVLQDLEYRIAEIEHREPCELNFRVMEEGNMGAFSPETKDITINSRYVISSDFQDYKEVLDTLIHEGRHAYQDYNIAIREVHGDTNTTNEWSCNFDNYVSPNWDFQAYFKQPVEQDAREFAEDVLSQYFENVA